MASVTVYSTMDAIVGENTSNYDLVSTKEQHLVIGNGGTIGGYTSVTCGSLVYFPIDFSQMRGITSATLTLTGVNTHNASASASNLRISPCLRPWSEALGGATGEDTMGHIGAYTEAWYRQMVLWADFSSLRTDFSGHSWAASAQNFDITNIVKWWAPAYAGGPNPTGANLGLFIYLVSGSGTHVYSSREGASDPYISITYTPNTVPNAPTNLTPADAAVVNSLNPTVTGTFSDPDTLDYMTAYQVRWYSDSGATNIIYDSYTKTVPSGTTSFSHALGTLKDGSPGLTGNTTYYWKARVRDAGLAWGAFSTTRSAKANTRPPTPTGLSPATNSTITSVVFKGTSDDADPGDALTGAQVKVFSDAAGTTETWDSGTASASGSTFSVTYAGPGLSGGNVRYWKVRTKDSNSQWSYWTTLQKFTIKSGTNLCTEASVTTEAQATLGYFRVNTLTPTLKATAAVTQNAYQIIVYAADGSTQIHDTGTVASSGTAISHLYAGSALSWATNYYWKVRSRNTSNVWGDWSGSDTSTYERFKTNSPPSAGKLEPTSGSFPLTLTPAFRSTFLDDDKAAGFDDLPSSYVVEVSRVSDSVVMHTLTKGTGLSATTNSVTRAAEGTALSYNVEYRWRAKYIDDTSASNADGGYGGYWTFKPTQQPTVSTFVSTDLTGGAVDTPRANFTWSFSGSGGKTQASFVFKVIDYATNTVIYESTRTSTASSFTLPAGTDAGRLLEEGIQYTFQVVAYDTDGIPSAASEVTYYTNWAPPDPVANMSVSYGDGFTVVDWDDSTAGADFEYYVIQRRNVSLGEPWEMLTWIENKQDSYYKDYTAGFNTQYEYRVAVGALVGSENLVSTWSNVYSEDPEDDWWVICEDNPTYSFKCYISDERHSEPLQEEVFEPYGRDRKVVVRSGQLGREGSFTLIIDNDERPAIMLKLKHIYDKSYTVWLKNPFGDSKKVYLSAPDKTYKTAGAVEVSIPYVEVE